MRRLLVIFFALFLAACSTTEVVPTKTLVQTVEVPVPVAPPKPPLFSKVHLPIYDLTCASTPQQTAKAYVASIIILKAEISKRDAVLDVYRLPTSTELKTITVTGE